MLDFVVNLMLSQDMLQFDFNKNNQTGGRVVAVCSLCWNQYCIIINGTDYKSSALTVVLCDVFSLKEYYDGVNATASARSPLSLAEESLYGPRQVHPQTPNSRLDAVIEHSMNQFRTRVNTVR